MTDRERIGKRIAELRKERGLSTYQLAEMCGLTHVHVWRVETGRYSTGIDIISKIANVLGCKVDLIEEWKRTSG